MVSLVNSHTNATRIRWYLWEIDLRFAPGLPPGWLKMSIDLVWGSAVEVRVSHPFGSGFRGWGFGLRV